MGDNKEKPASNLWWSALFDYQRQISHLFRTMVPEPFSSSLQTIEETIIVPMQKNTEHLSAAILNNSRMLMPWYEEYIEVNTNKQKQKKAS